jgi:hypothetical protein
MQTLHRGEANQLAVTFVRRARELPVSHARGWKAAAWVACTLGVLSPLVAAPARAQTLRQDLWVRQRSRVRDRHRGQQHLSGWASRRDVRAWVRAAGRVRATGSGSHAVRVVVRVQRRGDGGFAGWGRSARLAAQRIRTKRSDSIVCGPRSNAQ